MFLCETNRIVMPYYRILSYLEGGEDLPVPVTLFLLNTRME